MTTLHNYLIKTSPRYRLWHHTKHYNKIHWGVLVVFTLLVFGTISRLTPISFAALTVPSSLSATAISSTQINLSWQSSTDIGGPGVTGYNIYRCAGSICTPTTQIATSAVNSYPNTGLTASTAYTYAVSAYDAAGNESGKSASTSATTQVSASGNVYYVDQSCVSNGNGRADQCATSAGGPGAFLDPQPAFTNAVAGDTVLIKNGTYITTYETTSSLYNGGFHIDHSGTSGNPIVIKNYPGHTPFLVSCSVNQSTHCGIATITAPGRSYITIQGLKVQGAISFFTSGTGNIIKDNEITRGAGYTADGNWAGIRWEGGMGVGNKNGLIQNNYIHDIYPFPDSGQQSSGSCIKMYSAFNTIVEYNTCANVSMVASGGGETQAGGIDDKAESQNNIHRYNYIYNVPTCFRMNAQLASSGTQIYGNICNGGPLTGIFFKPLVNISGMKVYNNTAYNISYAAFYSSELSAVGVEFYNNIISNTTSANNNVMWYNNFVPILSDYNSWTPSRTFLALGTRYSTLGAFSAATGRDTHSISDNCQFVDAAGGDFKLQSSTACKGAGRVGGVSSGNIIDLGAYALTNCVGYGCLNGSITPDTQAPTIFLTAPTSGSTVSGASVTISANSSDNVGVVGVQFKLDGINLGAEDTTSPYSISWNTTTASNGTHTLTAVARDAAGNTTISATVIVSVNNPIDIQSPTTPTNLTATVVSSSQINLTWTASTDNVGVTGYRVERCQGTGCTNFTQIGTPSGTSFNDTGLSATTLYRYQVKAVDAAGNVSEASVPASATTLPTNVTANVCQNWQTLHPEWIFCDDFENNTPLVGQGRYFEYNDNAGDFIATNGVGFNNSKGMRTLWQVGEVDAGNLKLGFGRNPANMNTGIRPTEDFRDIYYRMYLKMQDGWQGSPGKLSRATVITGSDWSQAMIGHFWSDNQNRLLMDPARCVDVNNNVQCVGYNDFTHLEWLGAQSGVTPIFDSQHANQWYCVESHVRLNDPGQSNGVQEFWINGQLESRQGNLDFVRSYTGYGINTIFFENYWNSGSPRQQERYFDNIVVSTQKIGCLGENLPLDTILPITPTNLVSTPVSSSQINLSWTASTDDTAVAGYNIYRCAGSTCTPTVQISTSATNSYSNTGLTASTAYTYAVSAYDAAGNESAKSSSVPATTLAGFKPSDLNKDAKVDSLDFEIFKLDFNRTDKSVSDLNQDGIVDTRDLGIMMGEWGK